MLLPVVVVVAHFASAAAVGILIKVELPSPITGQVLVNVFDDRSRAEACRRRLASGYTGAVVTGPNHLHNHKFDCKVEDEDEVDWFRFRLQ